MKLNCVNDVLSWFDDACKNSSDGLVVGDDGTFRTCAYFVNMQFIQHGQLTNRSRRRYPKRIEIRCRTSPSLHVRPKISRYRVWGPLKIEI